MKEKSTWSFQVVIHLKYPVCIWRPREKMKQMSGLFQHDALLNHCCMPSILGRTVTNSFDPSVALGGTRGWFLQLLASQVVANELRDDYGLPYSYGAFL